jgi:hypothetical protein
MIVSEHNISGEPTCFDVFDDEKRPVEVSYFEFYKGQPKGCNITFKLDNPEFVDCFDEPFLSEFKAWQAEQEAIATRKAEAKRKREEKIKNGIPLVPPDWWKDDDEEVGISARKA